MPWAHFFAIGNLAKISGDLEKSALKIELILKSNGDHSRSRNSRYNLLLSKPVCSEFNCAFKKPGFDRRQHLIELNRVLELQTMGRVKIFLYDEIRHQEGSERLKI